MAHSPARLSLRELALRLAILLTAAYGLLNFSYKYYLPSLGGLGDTPAYYALYQSPLNFHAGIAPFVLRQLSIILTWLVYHAHIYYPSLIAFTSPAYDQQIFFAALLVNWLSLVATALAAGLIAEEFLGARDRPTAILAGLFTLLSFHAQTAVITDLADGPGWLLMALAFLALLRHARISLAAILLLAIFERELVLIAIATLAATQLFPFHPPFADWLRRHRPPLFALSAALLAAAAYSLLRRHFTGYATQIQPTRLTQDLARIAFDRALLFQVFFSQNIVFLAILPALFANPRIPRLRYWLPRVLAAFGDLILVSLAASAGNNAGRLAAILTPLFAAAAALWLTHRGHPISTHPSPNRTRQTAAAFALIFALLALTSAVYRPYLARQKHTHTTHPQL